MTDEQRLADISLRTTPITFRMYLALAVMDKTGCSWGEAIDAATYAAASHPEWPGNEVTKTVLQWQGYYGETK